MKALTASEVVRTVLGGLTRRPAPSLRDADRLDANLRFDAIDVTLVALHLAQIGRRFGADPKTFPYDLVHEELSVRELATVFAEWAGIETPDDLEPPATVRSEERISVF